MNILGISAYYHDSAACLLQGGKITAAAEEERFSRKKHDADFPHEAIAWCLRAAGLTKREVDIVAFYEKPLTKFERILETHLAYAPSGFRAFSKAIPRWVKSNLWIKDSITRHLDFKGKIIFPEHHESHAASAFYPSPFQEAAILTMDGVGEWATTSYGIGVGNRINLRSEINFPHSLGLLYSAFTYYTGFKVNSGEYKVMGLAPYGEPKYKSLIYDNLIEVREDGSFRLNMEYFAFGAGLTMTNACFHALFGSPPRAPESPMTQKFMDIARSIQEVLEEVVLRLGRHVHTETGMKNLCLAGGVALNCVANGRLLREGPFEEIWIQPAAGDAGAALGAALFAWHQYGNQPRELPRQPGGNDRNSGSGESAAERPGDSQSGSLLGPQYSPEDIRSFLSAEGIPHRELAPGALPETAADLIAGQNVVGWFQGRMEFGPRALGGRSILADARNPRMRDVLNEKIKHREKFRPFAAAVLREKAREFFELDCDSPYMLLVAPVKMGADGTSPIPAVTHADRSARVQTVDGGADPLFHRLLRAMDAKYKIPVIINTSFNVRGEPMVCSPREAYACFMRTDMDYLFLGEFLLDKRDQKPWPEADKTPAGFELD